ncbi:MAG TPA: SpoIIE family protein phosphatase [Candidatus Ozemobacteraceae bacterium]|nr:SpoIIE family protein phosphatase [Candidatus Ozemobacteraceae bacterium]
MRGSGTSAVTGAATALPAVRLGWARLLLVLVPLAALGVLGDAAMRSHAGQKRAAFAGEVSDRIERIAVRSDPDLALAQVLPELARPVKRASNAPETRRLAERVRTALPGYGFELFTFDRRGALTGTDPASPPNLWLMRRLLAGLASEGPTDTSATADLDRRLKAVFGNSRSLQSFRQNRGLRMRMQRMKKPISVFWDIGPAGGFLLVITSEPDVGSRLAALWTDESAPGTALGWKTCDSDTWRFLGPVRPELPTRFWNRLEKQGRQEIDTNRRHWEFRLTSGGNVLFLAVPSPSAARPPLVFWWGLIATACFASARMLVCGPDLLGPITRLSVLLFVVAAAVPTACAALAGFRALSDRREVLRSEVQRAQVDALRLFDERFDDHLDRFRRRLVALTSQPTFYDLGSTRTAASFTATPLNGHLDLLAPDSRAIARFPDTDTAFTPLLPIIQRMALEVLAPNLIAAPSVRIDAGTNRMIREGQFGFTALAIRPRRLNPMNTGTSRPMFYWDYPRTTGRKASFAVFVFDRENLMRDYTASRILESGALWGTKIRIGAHHIDRPEAFPGNAAAWRKLTPAIQRSRVLNKPVFGTVRFGRRDWWYAAIVGTNIDRYGFIALYPDDRIEEALGELRAKAYAGMAVMILLAAGLGALLSRRLTRPVSALAEGVSNLQRKEFNRPVRIDGQDELARLSAAFNEMMAELKDLDVAKAVQGSLLPAAYPAPEGYAIHGRCLFAGNLGGDCLDCRPLADGRILLLIGDVSGHGAASALLMAFIKATVTLWSRSGRTDLPLLANRIDALLRSFPGPRRFLAFFGCLLDPVTHTVEWLSGGHPYPLLVRPEAKARFVGAPGYPLGIRRRRQASPAGTLRLEPGDTLFFYTDGFVEALDRSGAPVGYERMTAMARAACDTASADAERARSIVDSLLERRAAITDEWSDDVTMLVLSRLPRREALP